MAGSDAAAREPSAATDGGPFGAPAVLGPLRPLDLLVAGYATLAAIPLAVGVARGQPRCPPQLVANLLIVGFALVFARLTSRTHSPVLVLLRLGYVPILFWCFYHQTWIIWPLLYEAPFDAQIVALDQRLFGSQASLAFQDALPSRALGEIFSFAYFAYYFFMPGILFGSLLKRGYRAAERAVFDASACFFSCYVFFWLFPTVSPHFWFPPGTGPQLYPGYVFNHALFFLTSRGEIPSGAFPSSHMAVAVLLTLWARRELPRLYPFLLAITVVMGPAVVYLRAHYLFDVPAGIVVGVLFWRLAPRWQQSLERISVIT
jgi:membrane-associated phospholipid phosphatase